jgi:hypothetical protein
MGQEREDVSQLHCIHIVGLDQAIGWSINVMFRGRSQIEEMHHRIHPRLPAST